MSKNGFFSSFCLIYSAILSIKKCMDQHYQKRFLVFSEKTSSYLFSSWVLTGCLDTRVFQLLGLYGAKAVQNSLYFIFCLSYLSNLSINNSISYYVKFIEFPTFSYRKSTSSFCDTAPWPVKSISLNASIVLQSPPSATRRYLWSSISYSSSEMCCRNCYMSMFRD